MSTSPAPGAFPAPAPPDRVKVLYLAGWQRSGSTVLANILGEIDGFFSTGELYYLWDYVWFRNILCGCGAPFWSCPLWGEVVQRAYGGRSGVDGSRMRELARSAGRTRHLPLLLMPGNRPVLTRHLQTYLANLERLYLAIQHTTNCRVIVDSSKWPSYGYFLGLIDVVDLYVAHLVRDPRAVAQSWLSNKLLPDRESPEFMYRSPLNSSARWTTWNLASEAFWRRRRDRYVLLRYEDFVDDPQGAVQRVLGLVGEQPAALPFVSEREVDLGVNHTVSGNPNRFDVGRVPLRPSADWRTTVRYRDRATVTAVTAPLLRRYGYGLRP
jgi:hypothetical protein